MRNSYTYWKQQKNVTDKQYFFYFTFVGETMYAIFGALKLFTTADLKIRNAQCSYYEHCMFLRLVELIM